MITKYKRKEYLATTLALFFAAFLIYGCISIFLEDSLFNTIWTRFLFFGSIAGFGFGSIFSGIILFVRFISSKGIIFKSVCCCLFPFTTAAVVFIGVLSFLPYEIYNIYLLIKGK